MFAQEMPFKDIEQVRQQKKRIILDYPASVPGIEFDEPRPAMLERTVICSDFFGDKLLPGRILMQHECWFRPVKTAVKGHMALAKVAGYRHTVYGLPPEIYPVLFEHPENSNILITSTSFANFVEGRFAPKIDWQVVVGRLQSWLNGSDDITAVDWEMSVRPTFGPKDVLPPQVEHEALKRNIDWFNNQMFFEVFRGSYSGAEVGVFEGYASGIKPNGRQFLLPKTRSDCTGEATMLPALDWAINNDHGARAMAERIMKYLFKGQELADQDPQSPTFGGLRFYEYKSWYYPEGRAPLACILSSELTENFEYATDILRNLMFLLRTTGPQGFRMKVQNPESFTDGKTCKHYRETDYVHYCPHFQGYLWAAFLQAYVLTGYREFLEKPKTAIHMTMQVFPKLNWVNGISQEYARFLLPLAFLVQIENTAENRSNLKKVAETLLNDMTDCGAIMERMGQRETGLYPSPASNESFGTNEASLIQENGDPACDLLYTMNYALIGLHEAAVATGDNYYKEAVDKMIDFVCRIQVQSEHHPYLDGCWMRAFDYELWEYYGSSADKSWGPWCVESGWTNTWISTVLGLRRLNRGLLCHKNAAKYAAILPGVLQEISC